MSIQRTLLATAVAFAIHAAQAQDTPAPDTKTLSAIIDDFNLKDTKDILFFGIAAPVDRPGDGSSASWWRQRRQVVR